MSIKTLSYTKAPTAGTVEASEKEGFRVDRLIIPCPACAGTGYLPAVRLAHQLVRNLAQEVAA